MRSVLMATFAMTAALVAGAAGVSARSGKARAMGVAARVAATPSAAATRTLRCGDLSCDPQKTYCETINTDVDALPSTHMCRPLPSACSPGADGQLPDCACFPKGTRCRFCSAPRMSGAEGFYRSCIGGD